MANELGNFLEKLRGSMSLREAAKRSGLSHAYIRDLEIGVNRATKTIIRPTPETLSKLSIAYNYSYEDLMAKAGYTETQTDDVDQDSIDTVREVARMFGLRPSDPAFKKALLNALDIVAFKGQQNGD